MIQSKYTLCICLFMLSGFTGSCQPAESIQNHSTILFNGEDLDQWEVPSGWEIRDGELYSDFFEEGEFLFTKKKFGNFVLTLEYYLPSLGNSGLIIRTNAEKPFVWETGFEVQLISPWIPPSDDFHCTGSIYGKVAVQNRPLETPDQWHTMEIRCDRKVITTIVDGNLATHVDTDTVPSMKDMLLTGHVGLQSNHAEVEGKFVKFRNIVIEDLDLDPEYVVAGFYKDDSRLRELAHLSAVNLGVEMIDQLALLLSETDTMIRSGVKQVLFDIVANATSSMTTESERHKLSKTLRKNIKRTSSDYTKTYLNELHGMLNYNR